MVGNNSKLAKKYYPAFSGKSLVDKNDHPGKVLGKKKSIHPWSVKN